MRSIPRTIALAVVLLIAITSLLTMTITAQTSTNLQPGFSNALMAIQQAETAGATASEIAPIMTLLNQAVQLNQQALQLTSPQDAQKRQQLLSQVDQMLTQVDTAAGQLQTVAAQRTQLNTIIAYVSGGVVALVGTVAYAYGLSFWRRYRIKRTFQMRVSPK